MKALDITREQVIEDMKSLYEKHGKLTTRIYRSEGKWSEKAITRQFGSFNELKAEATGLEVHLNNVSKELVLQDALRVYELEGQLTQELYLEKGKYSRKPILRHFGSWNNLLNELNIELNCQINIPEEELLADLIRVHEEYDNISATVVKHYGKYSIEVYQRRFGSFNKALELVGLETKVRGKTSPIANAMIKMIESILHEQALPEATADWFINPETGRKLYVDAFFPAHNLAFEYNGPQHYIEVEHYGDKYSLENRIKLDKIKEDSLREKGFNLLIFKYDEPHTRQHMIVRLGEIFGPYKGKD